MPSGSLLFRFGDATIAGVPTDRQRKIKMRKLSMDLESRIVAQSQSYGKSLRQLAVEFGISHETVRAIIRRASP